MERFVRLTAPTGKFDFLLKLAAFILICGFFNHLRHVVTHGWPANKSYLHNLSDASFTALPMCAFALLLIGHLNGLQKRLYFQATRDALTKLPNRRWFMEKTPEMIAPSQAVMIIDIDHFKDINDTFGHDVGDQCLEQMAQHLTDCIEEGDLLARIGGEEFAAVVMDADGSKLHRIGTKLSAGITFDTGQGVLRQVSVSVGIGRDKAVIARMDALKRADMAVYQAKSEGRAQYSICADQRRANRPLLKPFVIPAAHDPKTQNAAPGTGAALQ